VKDDVMGRTHSTHGERRNVYMVFARKARRDHQKDLDVGRRLILRWIVEIQDKDQCRALVNMVMNLRVP
jgi:hypothetical protein